MRRAARKDANHNETADYLLGLGWSVCDLSALGGGVPDLLVGRPGYACFVEVKDGSKSPSKRKLTDDQVRFRKSWTGPYIVATGPQDAALKLALILRYPQ